MSPAESDDPQAVAIRSNAIPQMTIRVRSFGPVVFIGDLQVVGLPEHDATRSTPAQQHLNALVVAVIRCG